MSDPRILSIRWNDTTPKSGESLCKTCQWSLSRRGRNFEEEVFCQMLPRSGPVKMNVEKCTSYHRRGQTALDEMQKIAWQISTERAGPIGFASGRKIGDTVITIKKPDPVSPDKAG